MIRAPPDAQPVRHDQADEADRSGERGHQPCENRSRNITDRAICLPTRAVTNPALNYLAITGAGQSRNFFLYSTRTFELSALGQQNFQILRLIRCSA